MVVGLCFLAAFAVVRRPLLTGAVQHLCMVWVLDSQELMLRDTMHLGRSIRSIDLLGGCL